MLIHTYILVSNRSGSFEGASGTYNIMRVYNFEVAYLALKILRTTKSSTLSNKHRCLHIRVLLCGLEFI